MRKSAGLTQSEMGEKLGVAPQNYSLLENGRTELTYSKMIRLAEIFNISVSELLGEQVAPNEADRELIASLQQELSEVRRQLKLPTKIPAQSHVNKAGIENSILAYIFHESLNTWGSLIQDVEDCLWGEASSAKSVVWTVIHELRLFLPDNRTVSAEEHLQEVINSYTAYFATHMVKVNAEALGYDMMYFAELRENIIWKIDALKKAINKKESLESFLGKYKTTFLIENYTLQDLLQSSKTKSKHIRLYLEAVGFLNVE